MFSPFDFGCHITVVWQCNRSPSQSYFLGSLSNYRSHSSENVTWKVSSRCFKIYYRVRTHLESPWKSLSFKIKIQGLESPWKLQSALESPWISVLTLSNTDSQVSKRSKHRKTYQGKIAHVVEEPKKTDSRLFFALNGVLEKWEMSPWKSLKIPWIFCS